jgi:hypothetical protein
MTSNVDGKRIEKFAQVGGYIFVGGLIFLHILVPIATYCADSYDEIYQTNFVLGDYVISLLGIGFGLGALIVSQKFTKQRRVKIDDTRSRHKGGLIIAAYFVVIWAALYVTLDLYRLREVSIEQQVQLGTLARLVLSGTYIAIALSAFTLFHGATGIKIIDYSVAALVPGMEIISQNRGFLFLYIFSVYFYFRIFANKSSLGRLTIELSAISLISLIIFAWWGAVREGGVDSLLYSASWRLAEPYWTWSFSEWRRFGALPHLFFENLSRLAELPSVALGLTQSTYSIEGADFYFLEIFGIEQRLGVSIPITFYGEMIATFGIFGIIFGSLVSIWMIKKSVYLIYWPKSIDNRLLDLYYIQFCIRLFLIYAKTFNGIMMTIFYENARFIFILWVICSANRLMQKTSARQGGMSR